MSQTTQRTVTTAQRWFQGKRVPLYIVVGSTITGALYFFNSKSSHPLVETASEKRRDPVPQEHPDAVEHGQRTFESPGRKLTRGLGLAKKTVDEPQVSGGIMYNRKAHTLIEGTPLEQQERPMKKPQL